MAELPLPAPLVTADVDLKGMDFMPLDTVALLDSDLYSLATGEQFKAAVTLWCRAWRQVPAGSLPNDEKLLAEFSGARSRWSKVRDVALRGFILCSDGRLYHSIVCEKVRIAWRARLKQRAAATMRWHPHGSAAAMQVEVKGKVKEKARSKEKKDRRDATASGAQAKIDAFALPPWMPVEQWNGWVSMRIRIKKPMTERARDMAVAKLKAMKEGGHDIAKILERSEFKNYTDLYPIEDQDRKAGKNAGVAERFANGGPDGAE